MTNKKNNKKEESITKQVVPEKDRGTVLPKAIGRKDKPDDDGLIRDCWGTILS